MGISGLFYSQIGYDLKDPMRALIRSTDSEYIKAQTIFKILDSKNENCVLEGEVKLWGEKWKETWWEIDFSTIDKEGNYIILIIYKEKEIMRSGSFEVGEYLLWHKTIEIVALDQMEERQGLARNGVGWKDCGSAWREVNSHATTIIGLCDLLNTGFESLSRLNINRLVTQIIHGCDYIALCQDKAEHIGYPLGSIIHEIPNNLIVIPGDMFQSVVALTYASRLITDINLEKSDEYLERAVKTFECLLKDTSPTGEQGFSYSNHGASEDFVVPSEWMTRDLLMMMWGAIELYTSGKIEYKDKAIDLAKKIMDRQVPEEKKEGKYFGHFYTYDSCDFTEKANVHHGIGNDTGGTFPYYIVPFIEIVRRLGDHKEASLWSKCINNFVYGFLIPACEDNPFYLIPEGYFKNEGMLYFCGPWHGINTSIGFGATLAAKLEALIGDKKLRKISVGNLQWIAGLNAGITKEAFKGCVIWKEVIAEGVALPYSQIHGIGNRYVGNWSGIKGSICNGFSVNPQFQLVVEPKLENDSPLLYTDEDWIPHGAGWISGLSALRDLKFFADIEKT